MNWKSLGRGTLPKTLLRVKYQYYSMHTFRDMDLNQNFNQSRWCIKCKWAESHWAVEHYPRHFHVIIIITTSRTLPVVNVWDFGTPSRTTGKLYIGFCGPSNWSTSTVQRFKKLFNSFLNQRGLFWWTVNCRIVGYQPCYKISKGKHWL